MIDSPTHLAAVTDQTFQPEVLAAEIPVLVDFWATWCPPCKLIAPILDDLATEYAGRLNIVKMDVDANPMTPGSFGIMSIPTLILFSGGANRLRVVGFQSKDRLKAQIDSVLAN